MSDVQTRFNILKKQGLTMKKIANALNSEGLRTSSGRAWTGDNLAKASQRWGRSNTVETKTESTRMDILRKEMPKLKKDWERLQVEQLAMKFGKEIIESYLKGIQE